MTQVDPHIFRAYDIRGTVPDQVNAELCKLVGQAFGSILRELYSKEHPTIVVGRDSRIHSREFEAATIEGLVSTGCFVLNIGETPSPVNYFALCENKCDGSIQITASHNEAKFNGIKLQTQRAAAFSGEDLQTLLKRINEGAFLTGEGKIEEFDAITAYEKRLKEMFDNVGTNLHVVIDNGNGVSGPVYNQILKSLGCELTELYAEPDGTFPNHIADPIQLDTLKELQKTVMKVNANFGIAIDGDGDRVGFIDENGKVISLDYILLLLAKDHLSRNSGSPIIFTTSNSGVLETEITKWGGKPIMCKVGHSFVEHAMREHNSLLGGEQSGHLFTGEDYYPYDDAFVATLRVIRILSDSGKPFSELFAEFPKVYQSPELRPHCADEHKTRIIRELTEHFQKDYPVNTLDGARIDFGDGAWAGIRQSNTSPRISICIEARSQEKLDEVQEIVIEQLKKHPEIEL